MSLKFSTVPKGMHSSGAGVVVGKLQNSVSAVKLRLLAMGYKP